MQTCKMCGARLADDNEMTHHNEAMHPNMAGKKGGLPSDERKPDDQRPID